MIFAMCFFGENILVSHKIIEFMVQGTYEYEANPDYYSDYTS